MKLPDLKSSWLESDGELVSLLLLKEHVDKAKKMLADLKAVPDPIDQHLEIEKETIELFNKYRDDMLSPILAIKVKELKRRKDEVIRKSEGYEFCKMSEVQSQLQGYIQSMECKLANLQWYRGMRKGTTSEKLDNTLQASQNMIDLVNKGFKP
jgi:hypothetical protein